MKLHIFVPKNDIERSVLTHQLTYYEKQVLEAEINQSCQETRQFAFTIQGRYERERCSHGGTLMPVKNGSSSENLNSVVHIAKEKGIERP